MGTRGAPSGGSLRPRVLVTLPDVAWPLDGGKRLRMAGVLRGLSDVADLDVAVLFSTAPDAGHPPFPADVPVRRWLRCAPRPHSRAVTLARVVRHLVPVHLAAQRYDLVAARLAELAEGTRYDAVWFGGLDHAWGLGRSVQAARTFVDCDDVETEKWRAYLRSTGLPVGERIQRRVELPLWARVQDFAVRLADGIAVCSPDDVSRLGARAAFVVPNTYPDPGPVQRSVGSGRPVVCLVANYETEQNVDAATFLVRDVVPLLVAAVPGIRVRLVGRGRERIAALHGAGGGAVEVVGPVPEVQGELARADLVVVPMRFGGGTRLKVLEAFSHRVPVVSTALGCEGLGAVAGRDLLIADEPAALVAACRKVLDDRELRETLVDNGYRLWAENFGPAAAVRAVRSGVTPLLSVGSVR